MELFRQTNINFVGKMRLAFIISLTLIIASVVTMVVQDGPRWGIDFRGGTVVTVGFVNKPPVQRLRAALDKDIKGEVTVQEMKGNQVIIGTEIASAANLNETRSEIGKVLSENFGATGGKLAFNSASSEQIVSRLIGPLQQAGVPMSEADLRSLASGMTSFRDQEHSGITSNLDQLSAVPGMTPRIMSVVKQEMAPGSFNIRSVDMVGPKASADLRHQALMATLYALGGMLVYIAFRFQFVTGVAAVLACTHDVIITLGFFQWTGREIDLTVIAALLTLIGYSMNDTIVVFDRVRENMKLRFRDRLPDLINKSVNQTLSRTILTSGLTMLSVLALYFLGGPVLNNFAFALVVGIIVGTYSSVYVAGSLVVAWQGYDERRKKPGAATSGSAPVSNAKEGSRKVTSR